MPRNKYKREREDVVGVMTRAKKRKLDEKNKHTLKIVIKRLTESEIKTALHGQTKTDERKLVSEKCNQPIVNLNDTNGKSNHHNNHSELHEPRQIPDSNDTNEKTNDRKGKSKALVKPDFVANEIIWAKIKGSAHWPAKIERIILTAKGLITFEIVWFNDYRRSKIHRSQAYKFLDNFEKFAIKFDDVVGLKTAAFEAMHEYRRRLK